MPYAQSARPTPSDAVQLHAQPLSHGPQRAVPAASVYALFRAQARRTPDAPALRFDERVLSYAELDARVTRLAAALALRGARPGERVALCAVRGLEMVVALLAILRTGAAYVPVDPEAPSLRLRLVLEDSAPLFVLCDPSLAGRVVASGVEPMVLSGHADNDQTLVEARDDTESATPDEVAYVIFTSGSTGRPKGVEVRHASLTNHALSMAELYRLVPGDRVLCSASLGFDVAAEQIYPALLVGAEVVVRPEDLFQSLESFDRFLCTRAITALILPTAFFHEWTRALAAGQLRIPAALRVVGVGTEQVSASQLADFLACAGRQVRFLQGYGPTEATITCTAYVHDGRAFSPGVAVPIGRPLPNTEAYVLDDMERPVVDGEVGELYIGGMGLARGYLGRDDLTRERFVPHPFRAERSARLYRTGDMVRRAADGQLLFVGREDFQIKVRGHRVEPSEIETLLCEQCGVRQALVVLRQSALGAGQLVAYVVADQRLDAETLTDACRARLPAYMVPSAFVQLEAFPLTLNQKVDRAALPAPSDAVRTVKTSARTDRELFVAGAFAEALGLPDGSHHLSVDDDFFELGGDSLRALRMLQRIRQTCGSELSLADVFSAPTVAALAARLGRSSSDHASVLCLKPGTGTPLFLVCGIQIYQQLAHALTVDHPVYALLLPAEGAVANGVSALPDVKTFARAYLTLLQSHTPHGPYALGGLSFGGAVAYELAQQLVAAGESVSLVALFDTVLPRAKRRSLVQRLARRMTLLRRGGLASARSQAEQLISRARARLTASMPRAHRVEPPSLAALDRERERAYGQRLTEYDQAIAPYDGRAVLYRATDSDEGASMKAYGFAPLVARLTLHDVAGDHLGILRAPGVTALAAHLGEALAHASV